MRIEKKSLKTAFIIALILLSLALIICVIRNIPSETEALFPVPDQVICYLDGQKYTLTREQSARLGEAFAAFEPRTNTVPSMELEGDLLDHTDRIAWEFRYSFPKKYTGGFDAKYGAQTDTVTFDKIVMLSYEGEVLFDYYHNGFRRDLYGDKSMHSVLKRIAGFTAFLRAMEQCVVENLMDTSLWQVTDSTPLVSDAFPAKPDSMLLHIDGRSVEITGADMERIHGVLAAACSEATISHTQSGPAGLGYAIGTVKQCVLVELRYSRRQKFVPDQIPNEQEYGTAAYRAYADREYDSLLFAWGGDGDEIAGGCEDLHVYFNIDGGYQWWTANNLHIGVSPEIEALLPDIRQLVR